MKIQRYVNLKTGKSRPKDDDKPERRNPMAEVTVAKSPIHGLGMFAARDFKTGERILRRHEREVTPAHPMRDELGEKRCHCDYLAGGKVVLLGFPKRHLNHCCDPNAYIREIDGAHYIYARRDIRTGEEITNDYRMNSRGDTMWKCHCGSPQCRHRIHSDFSRLPLAEQRESLPLLMDWFIEENRQRIAALRRTSQASASSGAKRGVSHL